MRACSSLNYANAECNENVDNSLSVVKVNIQVNEVICMSCFPACFLVIDWDLFQEFEAVFVFVNFIKPYSKN